MKMLVVNLARLGDLVQTTPATLGLSREAGAEVHLLVIEPLAEFASRLDGVDRVHALREQELARPVLASTHSIQQTLRTWSEWVRSLRAERFDLLVNLTHDRFSAHLANLLAEGDTPVRGRRIVAKTRGERVRGAWSRYFYSAASHRSLNPFNLADIYRRAAGVSSGGQRVSLTPTAEDRREIAGMLDGLPRPRILVHPGANHPARRWGAARYRELVKALLRRGAGVALIGGKGDAELVGEVGGGLGQHVLPLAGRTSLGGLAALASEADLLVGGDTGPLHVAAAVGTPTVSIFLAMARPEDTAPAGPGHIVLETLHPAHPSPEGADLPGDEQARCVPVEAVAQAVDARLRGGSLLRQGWQAGPDACYRVLETGFDERGLLRLEERARVGSDRDLAGRAQAARSLWLKLLEDREPAAYTADALLLEEWEARCLQDALDLLVRLEDRVFGRDSAAGTLAGLEAEWLALETSAGQAGALMKLQRLEREALYSLGLAETRERLPKRLARWAEGVHWLLGSLRRQEVTA